MKKVITIVFCALAVLMCAVSCSRDGGDNGGKVDVKKKADAFTCRLPNSTIVLQGETVDIKGTFVEGREDENLVVSKLYQLISAMKSPLFEESLGAEFVNGFETLIDKILSEKKGDFQKESCMINLDLSKLTVDMFQDETPQRVFDNIEFLIHCSLTTKNVGYFKEFVALFKTIPDITCRDYSSNGFAGTVFQFPKCDDIFFPEIVIAIKDESCDVVIGKLVTVEEAVAGKLTADYSDEVKKALGDSIVSDSVFALIPMPEWLDALEANAVNVPEEYSSFIKGFRSLTFSSKLGADKEDIQFGFRFSTPEVAQKFKTMLIDTYVLGLGKAMVSSSLKGTKLPLLDTLKSDAPAEVCTISLSVNGTDLDVIKELSQAACTADEWEEDSEGDDTEDEIEEDDAAEDDAA